MSEEKTERKKKKKLNSEDMRPEGAVEVVARSRAIVLIFRRMLTLVWVSLLVLVISIFSYVSIKGHKVPPQYVPITEDGRVLPLAPLSEPNMEDAKAIEFGMKALKKLHSYDYINWKSQFTEMQPYFTPAGWNTYFDGFMKSATINTVVDKRMIVSTRPTGNPKLISQGVLEGLYTWRIEVPIQITYTGHEKDESTDNILKNSGVATVIIQRVPITFAQSGVAIRAYNLDLSRTE